MMRGMRMRGGVKPQDVGRTVRRLMSYVARYRLRLMLVVLCIILSAVASVLSSTFIGVLIDDYISPLLLQANPVFTGLARALGVMVCVYVVGMISGYFYNRLMVTVAQGVLKDVRDEMFAHMQTLPIRYFDTHSHGEVMSHFTNDTDTLRQMIAQALPQVLSSVVSLVAVVCAMLSLSLWLTLFVLAFAVLMLYITKRVSGQSGKYFVKQQQSLADVNGYIEEMINGQKVVKVFCHEQKAVEEFDRRNDELCRNATAANKFANILGPAGPSAAGNDRQYSGAGQQQPGSSALCAAGRGGRGHEPGRAAQRGAVRRGHNHAGHDRLVHDPVTQLRDAAEPGQPAAQLGYHGPGGRGTHLPPDG